MWIWNYFILCPDDREGFEDVSLYSLTDDEESEYHSVQDLEVQRNEVEAHMSPMPGNGKRNEESKSNIAVQFLKDMFLFNFS